MREHAIYVGLPEEFSPPDRAAHRIAMLDTREARQALFARMPEGAWQRWIAHEARIAIALRIVELPEIEGRRAALEQVPPEWLDMVGAYAKSFWKTRDIRAAWRRLREAKRAAEHEVHGHG